MDLKTFKEQTPIKPLVRKYIESQKENVFDLRFNNYSYASIQQWLQTQDIKVSERSVGRFFKKYEDEYNSYKINHE